jgi:ornithine cyclodeaminase
LALQYVRERVSKTAFCEMLDMIADPDDPRDLYGIQERAR